MFFTIGTIATTTTSGGRIDYVIYVWSFIKFAFCVLQKKTASMHYCWQMGRFLYSASLL